MQGAGKLPRVMCSDAPNVLYVLLQPPPSAKIPPPEQRPSTVNENKLEDRRKGEKKEKEKERKEKEGKERENTKEKKQKKNTSASRPACHLLCLALLRCLALLLFGYPPSPHPTQAGLSDASRPCRRAP